VAILLWLARRRQWLRFASFGAAIVSCELTIGPIKSIVERARPVGGLVATHGTSFPSGHAAAGAVTAMGLVIVFTGPGRRRIHWFVAASVFAAAMAMSRTYLGVHWLSDVVAGACFGVGWALLWPASLETSRDAYLAWRDGRLRPEAGEGERSELTAAAPGSRPRGDPADGDDLDDLDDRGRIRW
jgi:undecaprenyl-diphosphatase